MSLPEGMIELKVYWCRLQAGFPQFNEGSGAVRGSHIRKTNKYFSFLTDQLKAAQALIMLDCVGVLQPGNHEVKMAVNRPDHRQGLPPKRSPLPSA